MKKMTNLLLTALILLAAHSVLLADVKIKQKVTVEGQGMEQTRMIKGARERRETKIVTTEKAGDLMPNIATITQCDTRRTLQVNDKKKLYTVDSFGDDANTTETTNKSQIRNPKSQIEKGGTVTITYTVTDTGERKQMFGLTARHLKVLQMMESSADSCGAGKSKMEIDGWYADFSADFNCPIDTPDAPPSKPDCRDRLIYKRSGTTRLGFLLDGTMKSFDEKGRAASTIRTETLEISRSPLNVSFFDVGKDYKLVSDAKDLYAMPSMSEMMAMANDNDSSSSSSVSTPSKSSGKKSLGLNSFTGNSSKIDQNTVRQSMMQTLNGQGFAASVVNSSSEISSGRFDYVVGVEIVNAKQSKAGKIGGLFGKVTGNSDAAKVGDSEAEVVVTIYQKDGKTVVAQQTAKQKISGTPDAAAAAAVENALEQLTGKIK